MNARGRHASMTLLLVGLVSFFAVPAAASAAPDASARARPAAPRHHVKVMSRATKSHPGAPVNASNNYIRLQKSFATDPAHWGGAYVDGNALVVKYVGASHARAVRSVTALGVSGAVRLQAADVSLADLDAALAAAAAVLQGRADVVGWGPNYANSSLKVEVVTADPALLAALEAAVPPSVPVEVVPGQRLGSST